MTDQFVGKSPGARGLPSHALEAGLIPGRVPAQLRVSEGSPGLAGALPAATLQVTEVGGSRAGGGDGPLVLSSNHCPVTAPFSCK